MAFDRDGNLFGATTAGVGSASELASIDPTHGLQLRDQVPIKLLGVPIRVGDLATKPEMDSPLYGLGDSGGAAGQAGCVYIIDPNTGEATPIGLVPNGLADGLAFGPDGTLYATGIDQSDNRPKLYVQQPDGTGSFFLLSEHIVGLDFLSAASAASMLVGSTSTGKLVKIDPDKRANHRDCYRSAAARRRG